MSNVHTLYPRSAARNRVLEFISLDWMRTKKHVKEAMKFIGDYVSFKRQGMTHKAALFNARNAI